MTSSDSGEDFESADEDFDFEHPSKQSKSVLISEKKEDLENKAQTVSEVNTAECLQNLHDLKREDTSEKEAKGFVSKTPENEKIPNSTIINPDKPSKVHNLPSHTSDSFKYNRPQELEEVEASLDTSNLSDDFHTDKKEKDEIKQVITSINLLPLNIGKISESKEEVTTAIQTVRKPEVKSKFVDGWEVDEDILYEEITVGNNQSKANDTWQVEEEDVDTIVKLQSSGDIEIKPKDDEDGFGQVCPIPKEIQNPQDGWENDGWEIEEEDGFEIPTSLAKKSDGSIQCAQEQICGVEFEPKKHQQVCTYSFEIICSVS